MSNIIHQTDPIFLAQSLGDRRERQGFGNYTRYKTESILYADLPLALCSQTLEAYSRRDKDKDVKKEERRKREIIIRRRGGRRKKKMKKKKKKG